MEQWEAGTQGVPPPPPLPEFPLSGRMEPPSPPSDLQGGIECLYFANLKRLLQHVVRLLFSRAHHAKVLSCYNGCLERQNRCVTTDDFMRSWCISGVT